MTLSTDHQRERQSRTALVQELEAVGATLKGNNLCCPFHDDNHPSAGIFQDEAGAWHFRCHGCGMKGDVFDIRARNLGCELREVLSERPPQAPKIYSLEELKRFQGLEALYAYTNPDTRKAELVVLRLRKGDGKTFLQGRPEGQGFVLKAPAVLPIYNRARVRDAEEVVVVEGEKCVHALHEIGITATTSPGGAGKAGLADWGPLKGKTVYLWPDNDDKGYDHMRDVARILESLECNLFWIGSELLNLPPKGDVVDYLAANGGSASDKLTAIQLVLEESEPMGASKALAERLKMMIEGQWRSIDWPWRRLSYLGKCLLPGTLTVICGEAGSAKSFQMLEAMCFWHLQGIKTALFELEEDRTYYLLRLLAQLDNNANLTDPRWVQENPSEVGQAFTTHRDIIDSFGRTIWDAPDKQITLDQLGDWVEARAEQGCEIIGIDPVTAAQVSDKPWLDDQKFILRTKTIMRKHNSRLIIVTHPRTTRGKEVGLNKMAGGAAYERFSQSVLWLRKHDSLKRADLLTDAGKLSVTFERSVRICKARNGPGGGREIAFTLNPMNLRFEERGLIVDEREAAMEVEAW